MRETIDSHVTNQKRYLRAVKLVSPVVFSRAAVQMDDHRKFCRRLCGC